MLIGERVFYFFIAFKIIVLKLSFPVCFQFGEVGKDIYLRKTLYFIYYIDLKDIRYFG